VPAENNKPVDLARIAWLTTVLACLIAVVILLLQGYYGYASVTLAVAAAAAINLR
jgi:membrane protein YdbS with pleckstrin-like domain